MREHSTLLSQATVPDRPSPARTQWGAGDTADTLKLVGGLIAGVVVLAIVVLVARGRFLASKQRPASAAGMMDEMRRLHESGKMSKAEFEAVRSRLAAKVRRAGAGATLAEGADRAAPTTAGPTVSSTAAEMNSTGRAQAFPSLPSPGPQTRSSLGPGAPGPAPGAGARPRPSGPLGPGGSSGASA